MPDPILEGVAEEAFGVISGLPPGTVTAASALLGKISTSSSSTEAKQVEKNTSGVSDMEKAILKAATANLAVTYYQDHPRASKRKSTKYAISTLRAACALYSSSDLQHVFRDALSSSHSRRRKVMITVRKDVKRVRRKHRR